MRSGLMRGQDKGAVLTGVAAVTVIGAIAYGGIMLQKSIWEDRAYSRVKDDIVAHMGTHMADSVMSARSSFVLGAAEGADLETSLRDGHVLYALDDQISRDYYDAGVAWQKEVGLSDEALAGVARKVLSENQALEKLRNDMSRKLGSTPESEILVDIAIFRGMLDIASDLIDIDERVMARTEKYLRDAPEKAITVLGRARAEASVLLMTEVAGNARLFATLQNELNAIPKEEAVFTVRRRKKSWAPPREHRLDTEENLSDVPVVETAALELNPTLAGLEVGQELSGLPENRDLADLQDAPEGP